METSSSTINKRWRICTLASFTGCIILVFCLNRGRNNVTLSTVQNFSVSLATPMPSNVEFATHTEEQTPTLQNFAELVAPPMPSNVEFATHTEEEKPTLQKFAELVAPPIPSNVEFATHIEEKKSTVENFSVLVAAPIPSNVEVATHIEEEKSTVENFSVSVAAPTPSNIEFGTQSEEEKGVVENKEEEECDIFNGKWIYNPKGSSLYKGKRCPFLSDQVSCQRNGRPDVEYEKWSWEAKGCEIPRFNATDMLERLEGKRVIIVGDSLNRNQWESLACLLYSAIPPSRAKVEVGSGVYKVFRALDYNCSVEFYWSPFLVQLETDRRKGRSILKLDELSTTAQKWKGANIMVFNTGHWWVHRGKIKAWDLFQHDGKLVENMELDLAFNLAMNTWARWIDQNVDTTKTLVFFRNISPEHKGEQWCYNKTQPIKDESYITAFPKSLVEIVERTIGGMRTPVKYLDITRLSFYRIDAHPTIYARKPGKLLMGKQQRQPQYYGDCSHWCLPGVPDTWNRLLYASMALSTSRNNFATTHFVV